MGHPFNTKTESNNGHFARLICEGVFLAIRRFYLTSQHTMVNEEKYNKKFYEPHRAKYTFTLLLYNEIFLFLLLISIRILSVDNNPILKIFE